MSGNKDDARPSGGKKGQAKARRGKRPQADARAARPAERSAGPGASTAPAQAPEEASNERPVTVVGIGASAGGLEALSRLFGRIPPDTGLAFAVVQHLSSAHESILGELLARKAAIPVHQATNGMRVDTDCVYVIAPDTQMTLTDGHLKVVPRDHRVRPHMPIDAFFRSLAEVQGSRTIGVILSGTGSDGALGIREIKGAGGITLVQDPATASSDGMPRAAIATNCADIVAAPHEIGEQLTRLGRHPYVQDADGDAEIAPVPRCDADGVEPDGGDGAPAQGDGAAPAEIRIIANLLRHRFGIDFTQYKSGTVGRRINRRMALRRTESLADYADTLRRDTGELAALYGDLLIGVTRFFRDTEVFDALARTAFPEMLDRRMEGGGDGRDDAGGPPVRVWIAGCSTGEEAYSFAICMLEFLEDHAPGTQLRIFATDVSEAAITVARAGAYPKGIEGDVTPERLHRFFVQEDHGYRVTKAVRDCCVFARQNITTDPPFSRMDLVSCRNVLIYLQPGVHSRILAVFHYALKPGGHLVLGTSESAGSAPDLFDPIDKRHRIYARAAGSARPLAMDYPPAARLASAIRIPRAYEASSQSFVTGAPQSADAHQRPSGLAIQRAADQVVLGTYAPAAVVVDDALEIVQFRGSTGSYLEPASGAASFDLLTMVKPELAFALRIALQEARDAARRVQVGDVSFRDGGGSGHVTMDVTPFRVAGSNAPYFIVSFEEARNREAATKRDDGSTGTTPHEPHESYDETKVVGELRQELAAVKRQLQAVLEEHASAVEEYQAATEEIESSNEELRSTNEEVETAKEELQSLNEELTTLNDELRVRNSEASRLNDDLTNLLASMHVPVIMVGTDLRIRRFTEGAQHMVKLISTDIGRPIGDIKSNLDIANPDDLIARVIRTLEPVEREVRDREGRWYLMHIRPYRTADHRIDGAVIIYYDIDARKRAVEQSDNSRRYAEAIVQTVREPLLVLDDRYRALSANRAFYDGFETSAEETIGQVIFDFGNGQWNIPRLRELLERVGMHDESFDGFEMQHDFPVLGHRTMVLNARRVMSGSGPPSILLAIEDVTDRTRAKLLLEYANTELTSRADELEATTLELREKAAEAEASSRAKSQFLTTMSHELRTPLNAIAGYAQLLDMGIRGPVTEAQHDDLARITRSQEHLLGLINEILNYAKVEAGSVPIVYTDLSVVELLKSVETMIAPQVARKSIGWSLKYSDTQCAPDLVIRGDIDKVRQILLNLLTNAVKFTEPGGRIDVTCDTDEETLRIRVSDTGVGIAAEHQLVIFEPFIQVNPALTRQSEGVGLGLAISRELARAMGGDITVESMLGGGSTFTLILPRKVGREEDRAVEDDDALRAGA